MSTEQDYKVDRTGWAKGPWDGEPDRIEWRTKAGLPALMVRVDHGAWCGYVAVPPGHPLHGKSYGDEEVDALSVHGGVTYGEACSGKVCHVPEPGEPDDVWWLGFDCVHGGDLAPGTEARGWGMRGMFGDLGVRSYGQYRDVSYVQGEAEALAEQLAALGRPDVQRTSPDDEHGS